MDGQWKVKFREVEVVKYLKVREVSRRSSAWRSVRSVGGQVSRGQKEVKCLEVREVDRRSNAWRSGRSVLGQVPGGPGGQ